MQTRFIGNKELEFSAIGIGAMSLGSNIDKNTTEEIYKIFKFAIDNGINHVDTAAFYNDGQSELFLGELIKKLNKKEYFRVATKAGIRIDRENGKRIYSNKKDFLEEDLDGSLKRLGLDQIDLFYVHRKDPLVPIEETTEILVDFKKKGKIKSFGFCEISPSTLKLAQKISTIGAVQSEYSLAVRSPELGLVQRTKDTGTALIAFQPLARSLLTDNPPNLATRRSNPYMRENPRFQEPNFSNNLKETNKFRDLAKEFGVSAATLAIAWLLKSSPNIIPIPSTSKLENFKELISGAFFNVTDDKFASINECLPPGWAHGDRYSDIQWTGSERYC